VAIAEDQLHAIAHRRDADEREIRGDRCGRVLAAQARAAAVAAQAGGPQRGDRQALVRTVGPYQQQRRALRP
jgi:hypothetical protein